MVKLTKNEKKLVVFAKKRFPEFLKKRRKKGLNDAYYACILSDSGKIYEGTPFETDIGAGTICCERVAIADMCFNETEKARVKVVLTVGPVGRGGLMTPCGLCRLVIHKLSDGKATFLCAGEYFERNVTNFDFLFKKLKKYTIKQLYPYPWSEGTWD